MLRRSTKNYFSVVPKSPWIRKSLLLFVISFVSLSIIFLLVQDQKTLEVSIPEEILQACKATQFQESCEITLSKPHFQNHPKPVNIIKKAVEISIQNLKTAQSVAQISYESLIGNQNYKSARKNCLEFLGLSEYRLSISANQIHLRGKIKDVRAWIGSALLYQYDCFSALKYCNDSRQVHDFMSSLQILMQSTSNALSMLVSYDIYGDKIDLWKPPSTERSGFLEDGGFRREGSQLTGDSTAGLVADVTVCKNKEGCFPTVQAAVDAAPANIDRPKRFVIRIKEGLYEESIRIPVEKRNLVFWGDGMGKTIITGSEYVRLGVTTFDTATVGVNGDGFMARDLTIQNTAGSNVPQAVAFRSDSDRSVLENCEILGYQDTLYAHSLRQFYKSCRIEGTVDFIFGNSAAVFHDCLILVRPRQNLAKKSATNIVTAHGRTDPAQSTGFVFRGCTIDGTPEYKKSYKKNPQFHKNFLGRPWKEYSRTVLIDCYLGDIFRPEGWRPWKGEFALSTLYYGEFGNTGPGSSRTERVPWSNQVPAKHIHAYSVQNFIQGDEWIPLNSFQ